jgi:hypothetical protein
MLFDYPLEGIYAGISGVSQAEFRFNFHTALSSKHAPPGL